MLIWSNVVSLGSERFTSFLLLFGVLDERSVLQTAKYRDLINMLPDWPHAPSFIDKIHGSTDTEDLECQAPNHIGTGIPESR